MDFVKVFLQPRQAVPLVPGIQYSPCKGFAAIPAFALRRWRQLRYFDGGCGYSSIVYVVEALSDIIQVAHFKATEKEFLNGPIHHHFELSGWKENKVVVVLRQLRCFLHTDDFLGMPSF